MTGGAGFSKQAEQSHKDNHALGKIRKKLMFPDQSRSGKNADLNDINDSIRHRYQRKAALSWMKWIVFSFLIFIILILIFFT